MKLGLGQSYDRVWILPEKTRAYADLTQPASTLGITFGVILASFFYIYYTGDSVSPTDIIYVAVTVGAAHGGSQALNQAEDSVMDSKTEHKKNRPIPSGVVTEEEARSIAWVLIFFAIGRGYLVNPTFGTFIIISCFFGVFYNLDPIRAKERIISIPWQAVSRGLFFFPAIWAAYGNVWSIEPWVLGAFMFWYVFSFQNTADIIDKETDRQFGVSTFVAEYGIKRTSMIASGGMMMMVATVLAGIGLGMIEDYLITTLLIMPFCVLMLYYMTFHPNSVSDTTGNHPSYLFYYLGMVLCVVIPLITVVYVQ